MRTCRLFTIAMAIFFMTSCGVPKDQYTSLEQQATTYKTDLDKALAEKASCEKALGALSTQKSTLEQKTQTYENLVSSLKDEIQQGKITISEMEDRLSVNLVDKILFSSGSASIQEEGKAALAKIASILKDVDDKRIQVEGHTDNVKLGASLQKIYPTNWELSSARAIAVVRFLASLEVPQDKLSAAGYSMFSPVAANESEEGRSQNRRIEIVLLPKFKEKVVKGIKSE